MDVEYLLKYLEDRLGRTYTKQRLGMENDHEAQRSGQARRSFGIGNLPSQRFLIEWILKLSGTYWRGAKNARDVELRTNLVSSALVPPAFNGYVILHLSDLHADISEPAIKRVRELIQSAHYDICVMTGDYRGKTWGPYNRALESMAEIRSSLRGHAYAVLGNHDSIGMVPALETMGIRILINEHRIIECGEDRIHLAGIDDAHHFRMENVEKVASAIPHDEFSVLLSHTPEIYRQAAHANFNVMLSGHTHGGQICLPGGIPLRLDCAVPRGMGAGAWCYGDMAGYTSVGAGTSLVPVRFNCLPEITLHRLERTNVQQSREV